MRAFTLFVSTLCASLCGVVIALLLEMTLLDPVIRNFFVAVMVVCFLTAYLVPGWVAIAQNVERARLILIVNALLGWTVLGWVLVCIWTLRAKSKSKSPWSQERAGGTRGCPVCGYARKHSGDDLPPLIANRKAKAEMEYRQSEQRVDPISPPFRPRG